MNIDMDFSLLGSSKSQRSNKDNSASSKTNHNQLQFDLKNHVWSKVSNEILDKCKNGQQLGRRERLSLNQVIVDFMQFMKTTAKVKSDEIATAIYNTYPDTFSDRIGGTTFGKGCESLKQSIYNAVLYRKNRSEKKIRLVDSDDEEIAERQRQTDLNHKGDQYGCIDYAPKLPEDEDDTLQEIKRCILIELFSNTESDRHEILKLMNETYPTQRASINGKNRNLECITSDWPFLKDAECLIAHSSRLLGKNVSEIWSNSIQQKGKTMRQWFKTPQVQKREKMDAEKINNFFNECKNACEVRKDQVPKSLIIFQLLSTYFKESEESLFKIIDVKYMI